MPTIYVYLLDEGTDVWRPVDADQASPGYFRITSLKDDPDETWQFATGELVRCEMRRLSEGECLVAVESRSAMAESIGGLTDLETALATYVNELCKSADRTHRAEDRPRYQAHLAEAARMFRALRYERSLSELQSIVASERRNYGWSFLSDDEGSRAESAFDTFATLVKERGSAV